MTTGSCAGTTRAYAPSSVNTTAIDASSDLNINSWQEVSSLTRSVAPDNESAFRQTPWWTARTCGFGRTSPTVDSTTERRTGFHGFHRFHGCAAFDHDDSTIVDKFVVQAVPQPAAVWLVFASSSAFAADPVTAGNGIGCRAVSTQSAPSGAGCFSRSVAWPELLAAGSRAGELAAGARRVMCLGGELFFADQGASGHRRSINQADDTKGNGKSRGMSRLNPDIHDDHG